MTQEEIDQLTEEYILKMDLEGENGYILECDLIYPQNCHDEKKHQTLPLLPEHRIITPEMLSSYQQKNAKKLGIKIGGNKLITSLFDKYGYVLHIKQLQQAIKNGMKLKKISKGIKFKQSAYLKSYIDLCTKLRNLAENSADRDLAKLMVKKIFL